MRSRLPSLPALTVFRALRASAGAAAVIAWTAAAHAAPVPAPAAPAVVELFTSQGCSSCPPADALLAELAAEAEAAGRPVFALSFHVDYWNNLGWADPFSRPEFTARQRRYADALGGGVYTPEMVVNGADAFVGSKRGRARSAVRTALARAATGGLRVEASPPDGQGNIEVTYAAFGAARAGVLNLALVQPEATVPVGRGENGGRTLRHHNVVRAFRSVRPDPSGKGAARIALPAGIAAGPLRLIAFAQDPGSLEVTAAAESGIGG